MTQQGDGDDQPERRVDPLRPEVPWDPNHREELGYRSTADDRAAIRGLHAGQFKHQMKIGIGVGLAGMFLLLMFTCSGQGGDMKFMSGSLVAGVIAWGITSAVKYRNGGFFAGLIISVGTLLLITGLGLAVVCGGFK